MQAPGWQLTPWWWGAPIGVAQYLLLLAVGPRLPVPEGRVGFRVWLCCLLVFLLVVPGVTGLLSVPTSR